MDSVIQFIFESLTPSPGFRHIFVNMAGNETAYCTLQPSFLTTKPQEQLFRHFFIHKHIYIWLLQPYGMASQKATTFLKLEPASLQSTIQLLSLSAMEAAGHHQSSQSKRKHTSEF